MALPSETGLFTYFIFYSFDSYSPCKGFTLLYLPYLVACLFGLFVGVTQSHITLHDTSTPML